MQKYIVMMGVQGAGKGTQSTRLADILGVPHVTSGGMFRNMKQLETPLAEKVRSYIDNGHLVPDDVTIQVVKDRLMQRDARTGFVLDGFPRTRPQAEALDVLMAELDQQLGVVVFLTIDTEAAIERMSGRRVCSLHDSHIYHIHSNPPMVPGHCDIDGGALIQREDDKPEAIRKRIAAYYENTAPLIDYYRERGILHEINGDQEIHRVTRSIMDVLLNVLL